MMVRPQRLNLPPLSSSGIGPMTRPAMARSRVSAIVSVTSMPSSTFGPALPIPSRTTLRPRSFSSAPTRSASSSAGSSTKALLRQVSSVVTNVVDL